jgi:uncharacterized membrane protein YbjE (DUF340 family)
MILLVSLAIGFIIGYLDIIKEEIQPFAANLFNGTFLLMLVLLGAKMFSSEVVTNNIGSIGMLATLLTVSICVFSVIITVFLVNWLYPKSKYQDKSSQFRTDSTFNAKQAIIPVAAIFAGAFFRLIDQKLLIDYDKLIYWLMLFLILGIGIDVGRSREELRIIKKVGWLGLIVPLGALAGSIIGSLIFGLIAGLSPIVVMAIGAGSGFYSVTAPLVTKVAGAEYGALALFANFLREAFTIILLPLVSLRFRHLALISIGGATTMDTTLPVIARSLGSKTAMIGLVQGIILSVIVPILLPIILGM